MHRNIVDFKTRYSSFPIEISITPLALGIAPAQLGRLEPASKARALRRAAATLLIEADKIDGGA